MRNNLRFKLIIFGLLLALVPVFIIAFPSLLRFESVQRQTALEQRQQASESAAGEISHFLEMQYETLRDVTLMLPDITEEAEEANQLVNRVLTNSNSFYEVTVVKPNGKQIIRQSKRRAVQENGLKNISETERFTALTKRDSYISDIYIEDGNPALTIGLVARDSSGNPKAMVFGRVNTNAVQGVVRDHTVSAEKSRIYVVNGEGTIMAYPDISAVKSKTNLFAIPIVGHVISDGSATSFNTSYVNEKETEVFGAFSEITPSFYDQADMEWHVISEVEEGYVFRHVADMRLIVIGVILLILILVIPATLFASQNIVDPIEKLQRFVLKVGEGNYSDSVSIDVGGEIGKLAAGINSMVDSIRKARDRDKRVSRMKTEFLSVAAHQLRTPLSSLKWMFHALLEEDSEITGEQRDLLEKGLETNEKMVGLVNDLLNISQIEEGKFGHDPKEVNLASVVEEVIEEEKLRAREKGLMLRFHNMEGEPPSVFVDEEKITLAVSNLVDNAIRYTPSGGAVHVYVKKEGEYLHLEVEDNGIGLPDDMEVDELFSKFTRGGNAEKTETEGSGLGLFLVKNIAETYNGDVGAHSNQRGGSTFYFTIPVSGSSEEQIDPVPLWKEDKATTPSEEEEEGENPSSEGTDQSEEADKEE